MSKSNVFGWLRKGWTNLVDPEREARLSGFVGQVHKLLSAERERFDFQSSADGLGIPSEERDDVVRRLFEKCVDKAWSDAELTEKEIRKAKP